MLPAVLRLVLPILETGPGDVGRHAGRQGAGLAVAGFWCLQARQAGPRSQRRRPGRCSGAGGGRPAGQTRREGGQGGGEEQPLGLHTLQPRQLGAVQLQSAAIHIFSNYTFRRKYSSSVTLCDSLKKQQSTLPKVVLLLAVLRRNLRDF